MHSKETPTTGVISNHTPEWLHEEWDKEVADLGWFYAIKYAKEGYPDLDDEEIANTILCDYESTGPTLIGSWKQDDDGQYEPDESGEYSAIILHDQFFDTQVIFSQWVQVGVNKCSPCFPGQCDLDNPGPYVAYTLPPDVLGEAKNTLPGAIMRLSTFLLIRKAINGAKLSDLYSGF